jgi:nucleoside-diphosphate-sugar epimerase
VLVTGATGALGRALTAQLRKNSGGLVVLTPGRVNAGDPLNLLDRDQIRRAIERLRPDLIFHLAATYSDDFDEAYAVNVTASRHLLEEVEACGRRVRVVLIGSAAEYGAVTPDENPIREDHVLRPVSVYGITKAWQTELAYLQASRGSDVVVARIFNLAGPVISEHLFAGRLYSQITEILGGNRVQIEVGPLSAIRDYLSIADAVTQLLAVAEFGEAGNVYHIASGCPVSMREFARRELAAYGLEETIVVEAAPLSNHSGYDVPVIYADITQITTLLVKQRKHV